MSPQDQELMSWFQVIVQICFCKPSIDTDVAKSIFTFTSKLTLIFSNTYDTSIPNHCLQAVDKDQSGKITALELREALVNSNWSHFNAETCRLLIGMFDKNNDGTIDFYEFAALWKYVKDWKSCFNK